MLQENSDSYLKDCQDLIIANCVEEGDGMENYFLGSNKINLK